MENGEGKNRIEKIWSLDKDLGIEFGELVGERNDVEVVEDEGISVRLIDRKKRKRKVEELMIDLNENEKSKEDDNVNGVRENVVVI